jgi:hypothetical protein
MKCPNCHSEQPPSERGPYFTRHAGWVVYLACDHCDHWTTALPVVDAAQQSQPQTQDVFSDAA